MHGNFASGVRQAPINYEDGWADNNDQTAGAPVCCDITEVAGGTAADGTTVQDYMAIASFLEKPTFAANVALSAQNGQLYRGVVDYARGNIKTGSMGRIVTSGRARVLVKQSTGANLALAVGDLLYQENGSAYLVPVVQRNSAGTAYAVSNHGAVPRAIVLKAVTLTTAVVTAVEALVLPPRGPYTRSHIVNFSGAAPATITACPWFIARGGGRIVRAGLGVATGGNAGTLDLDILINGTSIFTTKPKIDNDCVDPFHSLVEVAAPAAGAGPGTNGVYGLIDATKATFADKDRITYTLTNTSSFVGTHVQLQADTLEW